MSDPFPVLPAMSGWQTHFEAEVQAAALGPDAASLRSKEPYDGLTRGQILAGLWNNATPWRGQEPTRTEPMTEQEAETILAGMTTYGEGARAYTAVRRLLGRTLPVRFRADNWQTTGYDLYQDQPGLLERLIGQLRATGSVGQLSPTAGTAEN